jgi:hypothetical protein
LRGADHDNCSLTYSQLIALPNSLKLDLVMFFDDVLAYYRQKSGIKARNIQRGGLTIAAKFIWLLVKIILRVLKRA